MKKQEKPKIDQKMTKDDLAFLARIHREKSNDRDARFVPTWKEIAALTNTQMSDWNDTMVEGQVQTGKTIYDTSMMNASNKFTDGMQGTAFGRHISWFQYATESQKLQADREIGQYLQTAQEVRRRQFNRSNFYDEARGFVKCCADFGTAAMIRETDLDEQVQVYNTIHLKRYTIGEDSFHRVDCLFYDFWLDAFEAADKYGTKNLPEAVRQAKNEKRFELFKFTTYIFPTDKYPLDGDARRMAKGKPYACVTVADKQNDQSVFEGGYERRPFYVWRWMPSFDGTELGVDSPGLRAIGDGKQANALRRDFSRSSAKSSNPAFKATAELRGRMNLGPDGVTYVNPGEDFAPVQTGAQPQSQLLDLQDLRKSIETAYMVDIFLVLTQNIDRQKTATEVQGLQGEKAQLMAAFYGRLVAEFLELAIEDGYQDDLDMGLLPPVPASAAGQPLEIDMVSPLALLQERSAVLDPLSNFLAHLSAGAQLKPDVMDKIDLDAFYELVAQKTGVDKTVVRSTVQVKQMREARAKLQAQQMEAQQQQTQADTYNKLTKGPEPGSPAEQMPRQGAPMGAR